MTHTLAIVLVVAVCIIAFVNLIGAVPRGRT